MKCHADGLNFGPYHSETSSLLLNNYSVEVGDNVYMWHIEILTKLFLKSHIL